MHLSDFGSGSSPDARLAPVLHWTVIYHGMTIIGYLSAIGALRNLHNRSMNVCTPREHADQLTSSTLWRSRVARWLSVLHLNTDSPLRTFLGARVRIPSKSDFI